MSSIKKHDYYSYSEKNKVVGGVLYLVATPIGNLSDISERALKVLGEVDFIAAEDTRNSVKLLSHFGIKKPLISYFEHNIRERGEYIISKLQEGQSCALITDAGMPAISDPGEDIVMLCAEKGITVTCIPGASAAITALALSALKTRRFVFEGFLSTAKNERAKRISEIAKEERTIILYEAPHKLLGTLKDLEAALGGERKISLCRELTKLNEEIIRTTLSGAIKHFTENTPRGEFVLVIDGAPEDNNQNAFWQNLSIKEHVEHYINQGMPKMDAIKACAKDRSIAKSAIYKEFVES